MIAHRFQQVRWLAAALLALCVAAPFGVREARAQSTDNFASDVLIVVQAKSQTTLHTEPRSDATVTATLLHGGMLHVADAVTVNNEIWWLLALPPPSAQVVGWAKAADLEITDIFLRNQYRYPVPVTRVVPVFNATIVGLPFLVPALP